MTQINDRPMRERIARQLGNNRYECAICYQKILYRQAIWSCRTCFHIFHISNRCIVGWAKSSRQNQPDGKWSCPTCQTRYDRIPYNYYCFCGKERNPQTHRGDTPHSCGNPCGLKRSADCPHRCNERCHPGPCPECPVMTTKRCNCGNIVKAIRCGSGDNVKCDKICDKTLECGVHKCAQVCHVENCQPCSVMIVQECYCGKHTREVVCSENYMNPKYSCGEECGRLYNCKLHHCNNKCHPSIGAGNENADPDASGCGECPTSLNRIKHCPCGSKTLADLGVERKSCEDPIPTCNNICNRVLPCGGAETHRCPQKCHTGPCPPCTKKTNVVCRCRSMSDTLPCAEYLKLEQDGGQVLCAKRCKKKKSCGLHKCQEVCCIQEEHFCLQMCNKRLSCGNHNCDMVCHPGQCPRCLNASFDEQFCHCGRTVAPPPVPCGAPPPDCHFPCSRHHPCGHPVTHKCHSDPTCPPCTYLTDKSCYGGHEARRPIPCNLAGFSCGRQCLLPLSCGIHFCNRNCHNGLCVQPNEKCTRPCPVIRSNCEHPCAAPCHGTEKCPNEPCKHPVEVTCECGRKKQMFKCHEVEATFAKNHTALVNEQIEEMQKKTVEQGPLPLRKSPSWEKLNFMTCDDDCKKLARNKKVAEALGLTTNSEGTLVDSENCTITYTDYLRSVLKQHPQFVTKLEEEFQKMIDVFADPMNTSTSINLNFPPMQLEKRRFIHEYSSYYHIETTSVDQPPKRSIIATAKRGVSVKPLVLLSDLPKYKGAMKTPGPITVRGNVNEEIKKKAASAVEAAAQAALTPESADGLRSFKAEKKMVVRRAAPMLEKPPPAATRNAFALLDSDPEDVGDNMAEGRQTLQHAPTSVQEPAIHHKGVDWWSDEEEKETKPTENVQCNVQEQAKDENPAPKATEIDNSHLSEWDARTDGAKSENEISLNSTNTQGTWEELVEELQNTIREEETSA